MDSECVVSERVKWLRDKRRLLDDIEKHLEVLGNNPLTRTQCYNVKCYLTEEKVSSSNSSKASSANPVKVKRLAGTILQACSAVKGKNSSFLLFKKSSGVQSHASMIVSPNKWNLIFEDDEANKSFPFGTYDKKRKEFIEERKADYNAFLLKKEQKEREKARAKLELPKSQEQEKYESMVEKILGAENEFSELKRKPLKKTTDQSACDKNKGRKSICEKDDNVPMTSSIYKDFEKQSSIMDKRIPITVGPSSSASLPPERSSFHQFTNQPFPKSAHYSSAPGERNANFNSLQIDRKSVGERSLLSDIDELQKRFANFQMEENLRLKQLERKNRELEEKLEERKGEQRRLHMQYEAEQTEQDHKQQEVKEVDIPKIPLVKSHYSDPSSLVSSGFGLFYDYEIRKENDKLKREKYKLELEAQVEENRRLKQLEREKRDLEEKLEEQKRIDEQRRLQMQYEAEQAEQARKQQEAELKRRRLIQLQNERLFEEKQRQLKEEEERRQKLLEKQKAESPPIYMAPHVSQSPPVPVMRAQAVMQNQSQEKKYSDNQDEILTQLGEIRRRLRASQEEESSDGKGVYIISDRRAVQEDSDDDNDYHIIGQNRT